MTKMKVLNYNVLKYAPAESTHVKIMCYAMSGFKKGARKQMKELNLKINKSFTI